MSQLGGSVPGTKRYKKEKKGLPSVTKKQKESDEKKAWLKKTRNSPAARSGAFSDDERWALHQKSKSKGTSKSTTTSKQKTSKSSGVQRPVGGMGGSKSRYSSGVNTPEKRAADKKRREEREATRESVKKQNQARNRRRGTGVGNSSKSTPQKKQKKSNLRITTWRDLE